MKKKMYALLAITTLALTGCGQKVDLDLDKIKTEIKQLNGDEFSYNTALNIIEEEYPDYEYVYDLSDIGINYDNSESILSKKDNNSDDEFIVITPNKDKIDEVKENMDKYFKDAKNLTFKEIEGYLFYINEKNSKELMKKIEEARGPIFSELVEIPKSDLKTLLQMNDSKDELQIKESWIEESLIMMPALVINSNLYMVVKPVSEHKEEVTRAFDELMEKKEEEWRTYLPDQYEIFKNRKFEKYGDYLIYIVSTDNSKVLDTIKNAKK